MNDVILVILAFFTSMMTAVVGMGGGMMIISLMPGLIPTEAIIPLHATIQLASNLSRTMLDIRSLKWRISGQWLAGACLGATLAAPIVKKVPIHYLPLFLGLFILLITWIPKGRFAIGLPGKYIGFGGFTTFLSMFVGATGPLGLTVLMRENLDKNELIATSGSLNSIVQLCKVVAFAVIGFSFRPYVVLLSAVIVAVTVGSFVGRMVRSKISEGKFRLAVKILLSALAVRMIVRIFI